MTRPVVDNKTARRMFLDRHLLLGSRSGAGKGDDLQWRWYNYMLVINGLCGDIFSVRTSVFLVSF